MVPVQHLGTVERFFSRLEIVPLHQSTGYRLVLGLVHWLCSAEVLQKLEDSFFADLYVVHVGVWALAFVRQVARVLLSEDILEWDV